MGGRATTRRSILPSQAGFTQDMGGRVTRYPMRGSEKTEANGRHRDIQLGERWMDAMSVDYSCLFPTLMLSIGLHPDPDMEVELCWAYNRWLTEKAIPEANGRFYSMLSLPLAEPEAAMRQIYQHRLVGRPGPGDPVAVAGADRGSRDGAVPCPQRTLRQPVPGLLAGIVEQAHPDRVALRHPHREVRRLGGPRRPERVVATRPDRRGLTDRAPESGIHPAHSSRQGA
jgi:hypothetical protein